MKKVTIARVGPESAELVVDLVGSLLRELGEEGEETGIMSLPALEAAWRADPSHHIVLVAYADDGSAIGVATVTETFAFYASGAYGIINEMYVAPGHRSIGVGAGLIQAIKALARERGWRRIDVTAPESPRWSRTRAFYERHGFVFTGPKLKFLL